MRTPLYLLFIILLSCRTAEVNTEVQRWEAQAENIEIIRDDFGVPHIYGKTDADAIFGMLYAQCEDDFPRVERNYTWAIGRLAEVEGEEMLYSDLRARLFMTKEEAIAAYDSAPGWLKELCKAYADGINYYLNTHPEVKPKLLTHFEPWFPMYFSEGSIGGDIERVSTKKIAALYEELEDISYVEPAPSLMHPPGVDAEPAGSNGFAISGALTKSGDAMLLINPHTSFYFRGESHVVSEEGLNAYGATTWGQFFIYQGFNEKTGWMHTSTYTDVIDEFVEEVSEKDGNYYYKYGDEEREVWRSEVTLKYKDGEATKEKTFPLYRTHHGPITHLVDGKWTATALMWEPAKALEQSFTRTKKNGLQEFDGMMDILTNSSNNTVYADAGGNIAYYHGNFIPIRDEQFDYTKPVDGSNPATDWQGLHPVDEAIVVTNPPNGWIQNCNSTPFTSAAEHSPKREDYPRYMSIDRENFRGVNAIRLLSEAKDLTLDKLIDIAYDPYLPAFAALVPALVQANNKVLHNDPKIDEAIEIMNAWDFNSSKKSVAMTLCHYYATNAKLRSMNDFNSFDKDVDDNMKLGFLTSTIVQLEDDFGDWRQPWGEVHRFQRVSGEIGATFDDSKPSVPIGFASGRWGALAAYGDRSRHTTKKLYGTRGNSFVAVVEFGDSLKAKTILAGGQSNDPNSPHFDDQAQMYADGKFKDVAFYRDDVDRRGKRTYRPGERGG